MKKSDKVWVFLLPRLPKHSAFKFHVSIHQRCWAVKILMRRI